MATSIDQLLDQYERGGLSRRQLVKGLLLAALPATGLALATAGDGEAQTAVTAIAPATCLNHVNLGVSDMDRSLAFYSQVFGARERARASNTHITMRLQNSTKKVGSYVVLDSANKDRAGTYDHIGIGIDWNEKRTPQTVDAGIRKNFPGIKPPVVGKDKLGDRRISMMIYDPDGLKIQLIETNDDGWECPGITPTSCL
jgi:catechol 2,3-dioxygenase-like lactoylglutathione lyase family enzyme